MPFNLTHNTRGSPTLTGETRAVSQNDCIELLRAYGIGSKEDVVRVSKLVSLGGNRDLAMMLMKCFADVAREKGLFEYGRK
jgi:hypothetical protein